MTYKQKLEEQIEFARKKMMATEIHGEKFTWSGYIQGLRYALAELPESSDEAYEKSLTERGAGDDYPITDYAKKQCQCGTTDLQPFGECICGASKVAPV